MCLLLAGLRAARPARPVWGGRATGRRAQEAGSRALAAGGRESRRMSDDVGAASSSLASRRAASISRPPPRTPSPVTACSLRIVAGRAQLLRLCAWLRLRRSPAGHGYPGPVADFGAARKLTRARGERSTSAIRRSRMPTSLPPLERAADGVPQITRGSVDIVYANSNYHLSGSGMSSTDVWYAGYLHRKAPPRTWPATRRPRATTARRRMPPPTWSRAGTASRSRSSSSTAMRRRAGRCTTTSARPTAVRRAVAATAPATTAGTRATSATSRITGSRCLCRRSTTRPTPINGLSCGSGGPPTRVATPSPA